ncbi:MAG: FkbM family methyltransferase [Anaerolineae bacterium]|nr:FkbM family methyltransferase [Anaerolineae bacterium]
MARSVKLTIYRHLTDLLSFYQRFDLRLGRRIPWLKKIYLFLVRYLRPKRVNVLGQWVTLHIEDRVLSHSLIFEHSFEDFELSLFARLLEPGAIVLDIGANVGIYTLIAAQRVGPTGRVYAFEPDRENFALLKQNVAANGHTNVVLMQNAVSDRPGELRLYVNAHNRGDHRTYQADDTQLRDSYSVRAINIDGALPADVTPSIIKMDIQGYELYALRGMRNTLERAERLLLFSEFWPYGLNAADASSTTQYLDELTRLGFHLYQIDASTHTLKEVVEERQLSEPLSGQANTDLLGVKGHWPQLTEILGFTAAVTE